MLIYFLPRTLSDILINFRDYRSSYILPFDLLIFLELRNIVCLTVVFWWSSEMVVDWLLVDWLEEIMERGWALSGNTDEY